MPLATQCWQYVGIPVLQGREEVNVHLAAGAARERPSLLRGHRRGWEVVQVAKILCRHRGRLISLPLVSAVLMPIVLALFGLIPVFRVWPQERPSSRHLSSPEGPSGERPLRSGGLSRRRPAVAWPGLQGQQVACQDHARQPAVLHHRQVADP
jgi:hypothetical protein